MTWRMRQLVQKWERQRECPYEPTEEELEQWRVDRQNHINLLWKHEVEDAKMQGILKAVKEHAYREHYESGSSSGSAKTQTFFVTVNPKADVSVADFVKETSKYVDQKHVVSAEYVFEQRGSVDVDAGQGMHVHALVTTSTNQADFKKRTQAKFARLCGNEKHIHISPVRPEWMEDKRKYMRGHKTGEGKDVKVAIDQIWRARENLQDYYIHPHANQLPQASCSSVQTSSQEVHEENCDFTVA